VTVVCVYEIVGFDCKRSCRGQMAWTRVQENNHTRLTYANNTSILCLEDWLRWDYWWRG